MGLVAQVFDEETLQSLPGDVAIGHTRYSTTGGAFWTNAQPIVHHGRARTVALGHNGNLTNTAELRDYLVAQGVRLGSTSDTEVIAALLAHDELAAARGGRGDDATAGGRLLGGRDRRRHTRRLPRPARDPPALARPDRRRLGGRIRDLRARPRRRLHGARRPPGRGGRDRRGRPPLRAGGPRGARGPLHLRARLLRAARLDPRGHRGARRARADGRAAGRRGARRGRPRDADPRLGHARGDRFLEGVRDPVQRGPDQEPLRRPHVHPAGPGPARAGDQAQVQPAGRDRRPAGS